MPMKFPNLELDTCRIVMFEERHLTPRYVSWLNDPLVVRYSEQRHRTHTLESCREYFQSFDESPDYFLAIEARDESLGHIGNITVSTDRANRTADLSIMLGERRAWGKGYAAAAWGAGMDYLLQQEGFRKITAGTMATNTAMLNLMARTGMVIEGRRARQFICEGAEVDLVLAAKFADA
jgi:ribosomal-protein-alanine N-acetyltransferase